MTGPPDAVGSVEVGRLIRDVVPVAMGALLRGGAQFADAEDALQDAVGVALEAWPASAVPERPVAWLVRVAQRRLIAHHRTDVARQRREALVASWAKVAPPVVSGVDDSLTLLFMCCHPDLSPASAIPLTLRAVGGLTTREIAGALLVPEATVAQRISRAKATVTRAGEPFVRPDAAALDARLPLVLQIVYLIFTEGHAASAGTSAIRGDLSEEAVRLARRLLEQLPGRREVAGLLALLLLTDARRPARSSLDGELVPLDHQDRRLWDRPMIAEGLTLLTSSMGAGDLGEYQLLASIAALHDQAPLYADTDWPRVRALYDLLERRTDNPVVRLNRAVAIAHTEGVAAAVAAIEPLAIRFAEHHRYHATVGYLRELDGDAPGASEAYLAAAALAANEAERTHLLRRARSVTGSA